MAVAEFGSMLYYQIFFITLLCVVLPIYGQRTFLEIQEFYSRSFVPNAIQISYEVSNNTAISYNLTIRQSFPGKILMHIFVRKLSGKPDVPNIELIRLKNLDFCKTLESIRNLTTEHLQDDEAIIPMTFLISCPVTPGLFYIRNGFINLEMLPMRIQDGHYLMQIELVQVYEEVTKLINCRMKCTKITKEIDEIENKSDQSSALNANNKKHDEEDVSSEQEEETREEGKYNQTANTTTDALKDNISNDPANNSQSAETKKETDKSETMEMEHNEDEDKDEDETASADVAAAAAM